MHGGDGGHQREPPRGATLECLPHEGDALADGSLVPPGTVLIGEEDQLTDVSETRVAPGIGEEDQGQEAGDVGIVGKQRAQHAGQVEGTLDEVPAQQVSADRRGMPGRVEEMDDREHRVDTGRELLHRGDPVGDAGNGDLLLGPRDAGRHGGLADEERPRHLGRREPAHQAERQRDLGVGAEGRVTAREDQPEAVIDDLGGVRFLGPQLLRPLDEAGQGSAVGRGAPGHVEGTAAGHRRQPCARFGRDTPGRPGRQRTGVRVLDALLRQVDVAGDAHRRGEHERPLTTVRLGYRGLDRGILGSVDRVQSKVLIGRTSTPPAGMGICLAKDSASSRSAASTR